MSFTANDITEARSLAAELKLSGRELLFMHSASELLEVCNGVGPSWFPARLRDAASRLHPSMSVASMIHDMRYLRGKGTKEDFLDANAEFEANSIAVANRLYCWINPVRYIARHEAHKFRALLDGFGWPAYVAAIKERQAREEGK